VPSALRLAFGALERTAPDLAARLALRLWSTPPGRRRRETGTVTGTRFTAPAGASRAGDRAGHGTPADVEAARTIVANEVMAFAATRRTTSVAATVVALRSMANEVVDAELRRLATRLSDLDDSARAEVAWTVRRVVDKLLPAPMIKVMELAGQTVEASYTEALRKLFALDSAAVEAFTSAEPVEPAEPTALGAELEVLDGEPGVVDGQQAGRWSESARVSALRS
jgi:hypothetical protein